MMLAVSLMALGLLAAFLAGILVGMNWTQAYYEEKLEAWFRRGTF